MTENHKNPKDTITSLKTETWNKIQVEIREKVLKKRIRLLAGKKIERLKMKNLICFLLLSMVGCAIIPYDSGFDRDLLKKPTHKLSFSKAKVKLPSKIIIFDTHLKNTNNIFFMMKDDVRSYSQLVEYNLVSHSVVNEIISLDGKSRFIGEYSYGDNFILFSVTKKINKKSSKDIYSYNVSKQEIHKIASDIVYSSEPDETYPLSLKTSMGKAAWIEQDLNKKITTLKLYDLNSGQLKIIDKLKFIDDLPIFKMPAFMIELKKNLLIYDTRRIQGSPVICLYDINEAKIIKKIYAKKDILFHYSGVYNELRNYLAFYARAKENDVVYIYDLKDSSNYNIEKFNDFSIVYDDRINTNDNFVIYNVHTNISSAITDHYFGEIYDIKTKTMKRYKYAIDIVETDDYFAVLKFDKNESTGKVHFELYKKK